MSWEGQICADRRQFCPDLRILVVILSPVQSGSELVFTGPHLWSTIRIPLGRVTSFDSPNFVHDWILRSGNLPLTLRIDHEGTVSEEELEGVIDAISQCSNRWHSLSFDILPVLLHAFHHSNIQCHLLKSLRINSVDGWRPDIQPLSNPTMSPENIEIRALPFQSLQILWNQLASATFHAVEVEDLVQLFQNASQMTCCHISDPRDDGIFQIPLITHQKLKTLSVYYAQEAETFFGSFTLPSLQEFHADQFFFLKYLSPLVHRSSPPLGRITFYLAPGRMGNGHLFDHLQPFPGVTDLVLENLEERNHPATVTILLLEGYFPDLCYFTIRLKVFLFLWDEGIIHVLLGHKLPHVDTATKGIHCKMVVIDPQC